MKFMFGEKDTPEPRWDLEEMGLRRELWLRPRPNMPAFLKPQVLYVFSNLEKKIFLDEVSAIQTPTGYGRV